MRPDGENGACLLQVMRHSVEDLLGRAGKKSLEVPGGPAKIISLAVSQWTRLRHSLAVHVMR